MNRKEEHKAIRSFDRNAFHPIIDAMAQHIKQTGRVFIGKAATPLQKGFRAREALVRIHTVHRLIVNLNILTKLVRGVVRTEKRDRLNAQMNIVFQRINAKAAVRAHAHGDFHQLLHARVHQLLRLRQPVLDQLHRVLLHRAHMEGIEDRLRRDQRQQHNEYELEYILLLQCDSAHISLQALHTFPPAFSSLYPFNEPTSIPFIK